MSTRHGKSANRRSTHDDHTHKRRGHEEKKKRGGEKDKKGKEKKLKKGEKEEGNKKREDEKRKAAKETKKQKQARKAENERQMEARKRYEEDSKGIDKGMPSNEQIEWAYELLCIPKDKRCERAVRLARNELYLTYHPSASRNVGSEDGDNNEEITKTIVAAFEFLEKVYKGKKDESAEKVKLDKDSFKKEVLQNFERKVAEWYKEEEESEGDDPGSDEEDESASDEWGYSESREGDKWQAASNRTSSHPTMSSQTTSSSRPLSTINADGNKEAREIYKQHLKRSEDLSEQFAQWKMR